MCNFHTDSLTIQLPSKPRIFGKHFLVHPTLPSPVQFFSLQHPVPEPVINRDLLMNPNPSPLSPSMVLTNSPSPTSWGTLNVSCGRDAPAQSVSCFPVITSPEETLPRKFLSLGDISHSPSKISLSLSSRLSPIYSTKSGLT